LLGLGGLLEPSQEKTVVQFLQEEWMDLLVVGQGEFLLRDILNEVEGIELPIF